MAGMVHEGDLVMPTLRLLSEESDGFMGTADLIGELEDVFNPSGHDAQIISDRSDTYFTQNVRNLISHRNQQNSFITYGYADYDGRRRGLRITEVGRELLRRLHG